MADVGDAIRAIVAAVPTCGNSMSPAARAVRRLLLFDRAKDALGGAQKLGDVIGVSRKLDNDRGLTDFELGLAADAIEEKAAELLMLVADIRGMLP